MTVKRAKKPTTKKVVKTKAKKNGDAGYKG
jgi:hypothetical protein